MSKREKARKLHKLAKQIRAKDREIARLREQVDKGALKVRDLRDKYWRLYEG